MKIISNQLREFCKCSFIKRSVGNKKPVIKNAITKIPSLDNTNLPGLDFANFETNKYVTNMLLENCQIVLNELILFIISRKSIGYSICLFGHSKYSKKTVPVAPVVAGLFFIYLIHKSTQQTN